MDASKRVVAMGSCCLCRLREVTLACDMHGGRIAVYSQQPAASGGSLLCWLLCPCVYLLIFARCCERETMDAPISVWQRLASDFSSVHVLIHNDRYLPSLC